MRPLKTADWISDNLVLSYEKENVLSGTGENGTKVVVCFQDKTYESIIKDEKWSVSLGPLLIGGPYTLTIADDRETIVFEQIYVGKVYLLAGQSNIEFKLKDEQRKQGVDDLKYVRIYTVPQVEYIKDGTEYPCFEKSVWQKANREQLMDFSAIGYYIGKILNAQKIPIGLVACNKGGTSASCWVDEKTLQSDPVLNKVFYESYWNDIQDQNDAQEDIQRAKYQEILLQYQQTVALYQKEHPNASLSEVKKVCGHTPWPGPKGKKDYGRPCGLYSTMFSKIRTMKFDGVIWYQGEEDTKNAQAYARLLKNLIRLWRKDLKDNIPFYIVQLPKYNDDKNKNWPIVRQAQRFICQKEKNCKLVVSIDTGEEFNIHSTDKSVLGQRIGKMILGQVMNVSPIEIQNQTITFDQKVVLEKNNFGWIQKDAHTIWVGNETEGYAITNFPEVFLYDENHDPISPFYFESL